MKKIVLCLIFLVFFIQNVNAQIILNIQSDNEQTIKISNLTSFVSSNSSNESINLSYDNYIISFYPEVTNLNNKTFIDNFIPFNNDRYKLIWLAIGFVIIFLGYMVIKRI